MSSQELHIHEGARDWPQDTLDAFLIQEYHSPRAPFSQTMARRFFGPTGGSLAANLKRYLAASAISLVFMAGCGVVALAATLGKGHETVGTLIPIFIALGISVYAGVAVSTSKRRSLRPSNFPRIEHLRISGKYQGSPAQMGISPLRLKG